MCYGIWTRAVNIQKDQGAKTKDKQGGSKKMKIIVVTHSTRDVMCLIYELSLLKASP